MGLVGDRHPLTTYQEAKGEVLLDLRQAHMTSGLVFLVGTKAGAKAMAQPIRELIQRFDASQPVDQAVFVSDLLKQRAAGPRSAMIFLGSIAGVGLFIALIGVYGVVAFSVVERTSEGRGPRTRSAGESRRGGNVSPSSFNRGANRPSESKARRRPKNPCRLTTDH